MKTCRICGASKPLIAFAFNRAKKDGRHYNCRICDAAKTRTYYQKNKSLVRAVRQLPERQAKRRMWGRQNYKKNALAIGVQRSRYYRDNKKACVERVLKYQKPRRELYRGYIKRWWAKNGARSAFYSAAKRTRKLDATPWWLSAIQLAQIQEFYEIAQARTMQTGIKHAVDHIEPLQGRHGCGLHVPWNLQILTASENSVKGNRTSRSMPVTATPDIGQYPAARA